MFAIANMPVLLQAVSRVIPARYFVSVLKGIFLKGNPVRILIADAIYLVIFGAIVFLAANRAFKKKIV